MSPEQAEERAARTRLVAITAVVAVVAAVLGVWAWIQRGVAIEARDAAVAAQRVTAEREAWEQTASRMFGSRELEAHGHVVQEAMVLAAVTSPERARGWAQLAVDMLARGIPRSTLRHEGEVESAAWSPDGRRIVTASADKTARVWNADGRGDPIVFKGHEDQVNSAAWSPDGKRIVTASDDMTARIWLIDPALLQQALRDATTDCLTVDQRETYLVETTPEARAGHEACERSHRRTPYFTASPKP